MRPEIISSLMTGGSVGGGGQTSESIRSSVTRIMPTSSGGSVRDELENQMEIRLETGRLGRISCIYVCDVSMMCMPEVGIHTK